MKKQFSEKCLNNQLKSNGNNRNSYSKCSWNKNK